MPPGGAEPGGNGRIAFRGDAAFAKPEIYEAAEERGVQYAIRIPANKSLELEIEDILFRPPGRPSRKPLVRYKSFRYQAASWSNPRRIVAKVEHHPGELFPLGIGFIVTNPTLPSRSVVRFYNQRGTAEHWYHGRRPWRTAWAASMTASAFPLWVLAHRAIWLRLFPILANSRTRSRSRSACVTVQVRTLSMDRRPFVQKHDQAGHSGNA